MVATLFLLIFLSFIIVAARKKTSPQKEPPLSPAKGTHALVLTWCEAGSRV